MSSESAGRPFYALGSYAASKSAVEDTMRAWRIEHPDARFVTLVVGTTVPTEFASNFDPDEMVGRVPDLGGAGQRAGRVHGGRRGRRRHRRRCSARCCPTAASGMETLFLRSPAPLSGSTDTMDAAARATGIDTG